MPEQIIEEGATLEVNGVQCRILSVGAHTVDGEPSGFSYVFRAIEEIEEDQRLAQAAEERREAEDKVRAAERAEAAQPENETEDTSEVSAEKISEPESEISPEGSGEKTTQENGLPLN